MFLKEEISYDVYQQLMTPDYKLSSMPAAAKKPLDEAAFR
jgi:hypothetical protein